MFALADPGWFHIFGMRLGSPGTSGEASRGWKVRGRRPSRGLVELTVNSRAICTNHIPTYSLSLILTYSRTLEFTWSHSHILTYS